MNKQKAQTSTPRCVLNRLKLVKQSAHIH